jgi:hypothetical protein
MKGMDKKIILKTVVRTAVDGCFLPGTMMGTELMLLWLVTRKKELSMISLALISIFFSNFDFASFTVAHSSHALSEQKA